MLCSRNLRVYLNRSRRIASEMLMRVLPGTLLLRDTQGVQKLRRLCRHDGLKEDTSQVQRLMSVEMRLKYPHWVRFLPWFHLLEEFVRLRDEQVSEPMHDM